MTDQLTLTAAEISFVLAIADPSGQSAAYSLLGIEETERADAVRAAGLASLTVRGLATSAGERTELAQSVTAVAEGLTQATTIIQFGLVAAEPDRGDGSTLFDTGAVRFLIAPRVNRCFDITGLDRRFGVHEPVVHAVRSFLARYRPGVASVRWEHGIDPATVGQRLAIAAVEAAPGFGWATVATGEQDAWTYADAIAPLSRKCTEPEALERFARVLSLR